MRRRGVRPEAIRDFAETIGVARKDARVEIGAFEHAVRNDLNMEVPRVLAVLKPLKVVLTNYPEGQVEMLEAQNYPYDVPKTGTREIPFSRELFIDADDFMEEPPKKFFRLSPGNEVRLRFGYIIKCEEVVKDAAGKIVELRCTYDVDTKSGGTSDRKVKGTIQWVSAAQALSCEVRLYDRLFTLADPDDVPEGQDFLSALNPDSLVIIPDAKVEPGVAHDPIGSRYQFERVGYFYSEPEDSRPGKLVFNRIVNLRDSWAKEVKKG
jgi:glutaminyl-tRNA synthetase